MKFIWLWRQELGQRISWVNFRYMNMYKHLLNMIIRRLLFEINVVFVYNKLLLNCPSGMV